MNMHKDKDPEEFHDIKSHEIGKLKWVSDTVN